MFRTSLASTARTVTSVSTRTRVRALHSTPVAYKTITEKAAEVADKVNKKVGQGLASAIETGEQVTEATKETIGTTSSTTKQKAQEAADTTKQKAQEASDVTGQKAHQAATGARQAKDDFKDQVSK